MKSATLPSGLQVTYLLDGQSRRVARSVGGVLQKQFVWFDSTRLGAELNSSGAIVSQFIYGLKGNTPDYIIKGSTKYKVITDHLGSVVAVVNSSSGAVAQRLEYDEFGRVLVDTSPGFQPFGFAGGLYDTDTKLTLFGARSYDAEVGRWVSKDPILFAGGDTNLYGYVLNDHVNYIDPDGLLRKSNSGCLGGFCSGTTRPGQQGPDRNRYVYLKLLRGELRPRRVTPSLIPPSFKTKPPSWNDPSGTRGSCDSASTTG
ncbi:MAG: RHS repeat-associated core domain-containing protein [Bdellovibrionales bacterium]|nr:RHS repeat-associated core domain-containing protein [Bdellovibrionales bacterium]